MPWLTLSVFIFRRAGALSKAEALLSNTVCATGSQYLQLRPRRDSPAEAINVATIRRTLCAPAASEPIHFCVVGSGPAGFYACDQASGTLANTVTIVAGDYYSCSNLVELWQGSAGSLNWECQLENKLLLVEPYDKKRPQDDLK